MTLRIEEIERLSTDLGTVTSGHIKNAGNTAAIRMSGATALPTTNFIDFTATGTDPFFKHPGCTLLADGTATFKAVTIDAETPISKTVRFSHAIFVPKNNSGVWAYKTASISANQIGTTDYFAPLTIPKGVTITLFKMQTFRQSAAGSVLLSLYRCDDSGGAVDVCDLTRNTGTGWSSTTSAALSEAIGNNHYTLYATLNNNTGSGVDDIQLAWFEVTYTMPSYDLGL